jgi:hypothetical protein
LPRPAAIKQSKFDNPNEFPWILKAFRQIVNAQQISHITLHPIQ